jgi:hypothetical protein
MILDFDLQILILVVSTIFYSYVKLKLPYITAIMRNAPLIQLVHQIDGQIFLF